MGEWSTRVISDLRSTVALGIDRNLVAYGCGCGVSRTEKPEVFRMATSEHILP